MERRSPCVSFGSASGRDAMRDRGREALLGGIDAHVHLGRVPGVGRVDVVGAGAREADEVGHARAGARSRPGATTARRRRSRLCASNAVLKKKLIAGQPLRGSIVYGISCAVEVVGAVDVPEVAHVLVVLGRAGERRRCRGGRPCRGRPRRAARGRGRRTSSRGRAAGRRCPSASASPSRRGRAPRPSCSFGARGRRGSRSTAGPCTSITWMYSPAFTS